jgi:hypothetical protein
MYCLLSVVCTDIVINDFRLMNVYYWTTQVFFVYHSI